MNALYTANAFMQHIWNAKHWRSFHSPYLFRLFTYCCEQDEADGRFDSIEAQRQALCRSKVEIDRMDYGAGSVSGNNRKQQLVSAIARHALSHPSQCRFLARMAQFIQATSILELGTSLGIMTAYLKTANPATAITTVEGDPAISSIANTNWHALGLPGIISHNTTFENYLASQDFQQSNWDLIFVDGNHRAEAVLSYFDKIKSHIDTTSVIVIDDIYWSTDMQSGWQELIHQPEVTQSVDCFRFGLLFFNVDFLAKEHHRVILL